MFVYQADTYCDSCGHALRENLTDAGLAPLDPDDEYSYDSDDFPKGPVADEAWDYPNHCASARDCLEPITLVEYGLSTSAEMFGAESHLIGALLTESLTDEGIAYLAEMLAEEPRTPYQEALHRFWREVFAEELTAV
jgi:hypothetical protein